MNQHTRNIIVDSLILVAFSSLLGGLSLLVSKSFSGDPNPALDLITVMKKAEAKEVNASSEQEEKEARVKGMKEFEQTLKEGEELAAAEGKAFVNMTDPHGRTPVMWVCYANYNNIETTLKLEATRAPYLDRLLEDPRVEIDRKDKDGWTARHWASWSGLDRLSDMLIERNADINNREGNGFTPLMLAAMRGNFQVAALLLEKGADINYHKPDMVFPYASTPVTEAARSNNFSMVRWLVEQGANITLVDKYGDRPYSVAVQNKNQEMADYLKALEPEEWHNEQEKIRQLMPYKLPAKLVEYLKTGPLRLEFPDQEWVKWAELYSFMDVQEMTWKRKKLLSLMVQMDNYSDYLLLWSPRDKKLWYLDIEHEEFHPLAKWDDFIANPGRYLNGMIEGEFEE